MLARFVDEMFSMRHVKCCCPLGNSHLTHDALISAAALDQNKVTERESERDAKSVTKRVRESEWGNSLKELDNRSRYCSFHMWRYRVKILRKQQSYQHEIKFIYCYAMRLCA